MRLQYLSACTALITAIFLGGCCCGPYGGGCVGGPGGCVTQCNDCEGSGFCGPRVAYGPLQHLTQMRKSLVCGGGCGEVYYGEWQSTPPDACDPCCDDRFVGGAVPCQPFCWQPGFWLRFLTGFYGDRFCEACGNSASHCGCGLLDNSCGCDSAVVGQEAGCATCNAGDQIIPSTRVATPTPVNKTSMQPRAARSRPGAANHVGNTVTTNR